MVRRGQGGGVGGGPVDTGNGKLGDHYGYNFFFFFFWSGDVFGLGIRVVLIIK